jgi:hypothetical protein
MRVTRLVTTVVLAGSAVVAAPVSALAAETESATLTCGTMTYEVTGFGRGQTLIWSAAAATSWSSSRARSPRAASSPTSPASGPGQTSSSAPRRRRAGRHTPSGASSRLAAEPAAAARRDAGEGMLR